MIDTNKTFRIGPIRPPSEAQSLLLQVTNGCTWNKCKFCGLYKHTKFKAYSVDSIKSDIDNLVYWKERSLKHLRVDGTWDIDGINYELASCPHDERQCFYMVASWLINGGENVFLQDGNTTILQGGKLSDVIIYLKEAFPSIKRITSYGRAENLAKVSPEEFSQLKEAGLDRIHSGFETGSDKVLKLINKGVTKEQEITAGRNVKAGGIELSIYFMPGIGGDELSIDNANETLDVVNAVNPDFLRIRTAAIKPGTQLYDDYKEGKFKLCSEEKKLLEIRTIVEKSCDIDTTIVSDHMINLLEDVHGHLCDDKQKLLNIIDEYLDLSPDRKLLFQTARRFFFIKSVSEIDDIDSTQIEQIKRIYEKVNDPYTWEEQINECISRYI